MTSILIHERCAWQSQILNDPQLRAGNPASDLAYIAMRSDRRTHEEARKIALSRPLADLAVSEKLICEIRAETGRLEEEDWHRSEADRRARKAGLIQ